MDLHNSRLNRQELTPLYRQLKDRLGECIGKGEFRPGDQLPSEHQLCEIFGVSRTTTRLALQELVNEGVLGRHVGKGTFVLPQKKPAFVVGLVIVGFDDESYLGRGSVFGELLRGISSVTERESMLLKPMFFPAATGFSDALRSVMRGERVHGLLLRPRGNFTVLHHTMLLDSVPYVVIKRYAPGVKSNCVVSNDRRGARRAVTHLIDLGHREIGFISGPVDVVLWRDRLEGYEEALAAAEIPLRSTLIATALGDLEEDGYQQMKALLCTSRPPTAVFAAGDLIAIGAYRAIREEGLGIPKDLSVVGYDDIESTARLSPPLTTVRTSYFEFGRRSLELLLAVMKDPGRAPQKVTIQARLIVRGSTSAPKAPGQ